MLCFIRCFLFLANNLHNGDLGPTYNHGRSRSGAEDHSEPPRPPPPRPEGINNIKKYDIINNVFFLFYLGLPIRVILFYRKM